MRILLKIWSRVDEMENENAVRKQTWKQFSLNFLISFAVYALQGIVFC